MSKYTCIQCGEIFNRKCNYTRHSKLKNCKLKNIDNIINYKVNEKVKMILQKHEKGQYFSKNIFLKENIYKLIKNNPSNILEPSVGRGDLVDYIKKQNNQISFDLYEIDESIQFLPSINKNDVIFGDFLEQKINKKYKTIIGNPPYLKLINEINLYLKFINTCYDLLELNGELIFIVPSDFLKLTSAKKIINKMYENGTFTDIIHPHNEKLFNNAYIDIIIFRYCKNNKLEKKVNYNNKIKYLHNINGIITFLDENPSSFKKIDDYFNIYVGMVTGKENVFKNNKFGNINILNNENQIDKYILLNNFPTKNNELNNYMLKNKKTLMGRKIKKMTEENWFTWGALRNKSIIENNLNKKCIYIKNLTRSEKIAFIGNVTYFGGKLLLMIPKKEIDLEKVIQYLNSKNFKKNYTYSGRFKIGHSQLKNSLFKLKFI